MQEADLIDVAHEAIPYEDVVGVGLFQPAGKRMPAWTLVAVTEAKVHIFAVRSVVPDVTVSPVRPFASLNRSTTVARRTGTSLVLTDTDTGHEYRFEGAPGHAEYVLKELQAD